MALVYKAAVDCEYFGVTYAAGDIVDTAGWGPEDITRLLAHRPVYVAETGGAGLVGFDQIELDFAGDLNGDASSTQEWATPLTMNRQAVQDWSGVMEATSIEVTLPANATVGMRWITDRTTKTLDWAGLKIRKVRNSAGAYVAQPRWSASMNSAGPAESDGSITFDTFDTATSDLTEGVDARHVKFLTAGTYRIYSELDIHLG